LTAAAALLPLLGRRDRRAVFAGRWRREDGDPADLLDAHLRGDLLLGALHGGDQATTLELAWDIDGSNHDKADGAPHNPRAALDVLLDVVRDEGLSPPIVAVSKSGMGLHARALLDGGVASRDAHAMAKRIAARTGHQEVNCIYPGAPAGDGVVLGLPLCALNADCRPTWIGGNGTRFVHPISLEPYADDVQIEVLTDWPRTNAARIPQAVDEPAPVRAEPTTAWRKPLPLHRNELDVLAERCEFVQHCGSDVASITYEQWFSLATVLHAFPGGADLFDAISACDPKRYDGAKAIQRKLDSISGKPRLCRNLGYHCSKLAECSAIGVRSPAGLPFKLAKVDAEKRRKKAHA